MGQFRPPSWPRPSRTAWTSWSWWACPYGTSGKLHCGFEEQAAGYFADGMPVPRTAETIVTSFYKPTQEWVDSNNAAREQSGVWVKKTMEALNWFDIVSRLPKIKPAQALSCTVNTTLSARAGGGHPAIQPAQRREGHPQGLGPRAPGGGTRGVPGCCPALLERGRRTELISTYCPNGNGR